jgi:hypothetical protein
MCILFPSIQRSPKTGSGRARALRRASAAANYCLLLRDTTELGAKICGAELGATSTPRCLACASALGTSAP